MRTKVEAQLQNIEEVGVICTPHTRLPGVGPARRGRRARFEANAPLTTLATLLYETHEILNVSYRNSISLFWLY